ncbi:MAG: substrate-binding domain-containing protein [Negativicutes bacterium]|jgi:phosphate transport system substrate-binding protein
MKKLIIIAGFLYLIASLAGCTLFGKTASEDYIISIPGAIEPEMQTIAADYEKSHDNSKFILRENNSAIAVTMVEERSMNAAVTFYPAVAKAGFKVRQIGVMPFVFIVNYAAKISNLSSEQIAGIFSNKYTNWRQLGGKDLPIVILHPNYNTALPEAVRRIFLHGAEFTGQPLYADSSWALPDKVEKIDGSISYMEAPLLQQMNGYYYAVDILSINGKQARKENVANGSYVAVLPINVVYKDNNAAEKMVDYLAAEITKYDFNPDTSTAVSTKNP